MRLDVRLMLLVALLLFIPHTILALTIETCSSNGNEWECEEGKICTCEISGDCTNGNLLVYKRSLADLLCAPPIINGITEIDWDYCRNPEDEVKIIADCEEGQSEEERVWIVAMKETTTTTEETTTTFSEKTECPYECCENEPYYYDKYCEEGYVCIENECVKAEEEEEKKKGAGFGWILTLILIFAIAVGVILFLRKKAPSTYEELYRKWSRRKY